MATSTFTSGDLELEPSGGSAEPGEATVSEELHVLLIPTVMELLFSHMDFVTLQASRLVCRTWKEANAKLIAERSVIRLDGQRFSRSRGELDTFVAGLEQMGSGNRKGQRYTHFVWIHAEWVNPFKTYFTSNGNGNFVRLLHFRVHLAAEQKFNVSVEFFNEMLKACPNLEELDICLGTDFMKKGKMLLDGEASKKKLKLTSVTLNMETGIDKHLLRDFMRACPSLRSFNVALRGDKTSVNTDLMQDLFKLGEIGQINLSKLPRVSVSWLNFVACDAAVQSMLRQQLNLSYLNINLRLDVEDTLDALLRHLRRTLRTLILGYKEDIMRITIPKCMERLEWFEIRTTSNSVFIGPLESVADANLPNLKTFILQREMALEIAGCPQFPGILEPEYDFTNCWSSLTPGWFNRRNEHLETLQLPSGLTKAEHFQEVMIAFPRLRDLRLQNPSPDVIKAVFSMCTHLERLSIRLLAFPTNIDSLLTGLSRKICAHMVKEGKYGLKDPAQVKKRAPGLEAMKNLRYFELREWSDSSKSSRLSEVALWQGFMKLKNVVKMDLNGCHRLSKESVEALRSALGPKCDLNISDMVGCVGDEMLQFTGMPKRRECSKLCYFDFWSRDYDKHRKICLEECCYP